MESTKDTQELTVSCYSCSCTMLKEADLLYFKTHQQHFYLCDDCRRCNAVSMILDALKIVRHRIDVKKVKEILRLFCSEDNEHTTPLSRSDS